MSKEDQRLRKHSQNGKDGKVANPNGGGGSQQQAGSLIAPGTTGPTFRRIRWMPHRISLLITSSATGKNNDPKCRGGWHHLAVPRVIKLWKKLRTKSWFRSPKMSGLWPICLRAV